jgi:hypothetical protein
VGQQLIRSSCVPITCHAGQKLNLNFKNCVPIKCPVGNQLKGNDCVPIICPVGQVLNGSECVSINSPIGTRYILILVASTLLIIICIYPFSSQPVPTLRPNQMFKQPYGTNNRKEPGVIQLIRKNVLVCIFTLNC